MSKSVIKVENLSKRYRIGLKEKRADTFAGQMMNLVRSPIDNFRQLRSLSKFKEEDESVFWALKDINFEVQEGEVLGIIGHNGAGKSTLLKILSRITGPTSGQVKLWGRVSALLEVGTGFHPELTGRENIYMNGTILGMTRREIDHKFDEIVDFSGVEQHIDTPVKFYSSGMKVRLGFAVAAHLEPEILIIDEVLAVGDADFQRKCLGKMEDVSKEGRTVLFVSHDMGAVASLCPMAMLLKSGQITCQGISSDVIEKYLGSEGAAESNYEVNSEEISVRSVNTYSEDSEIRIEINYLIKREVKDLFIGVSLKDNRGNRIFKTFDLENASFTNRAKGDYKSIFTFSSQILFPGKYHINLHVMIHRFKWILRESSNIPIEIPYRVNTHGIDLKGLISSPGNWQIV